MGAGVEATDAAVIVFLDADLIGLRPDHVDGLAHPVLEGTAGMVCGLFDRGWLNPVFLHALPILTGERALHRRLFESLDPDEAHGYRVEAALNSRCSELNIPTLAFVCDGLWHRTKERKYPNAAEGFARKALMLSSAASVYATRALGGGRRRVSVSVSNE